MKKGENKPESANLRQKAEELLKKEQPNKRLALSEAETLKLIHELEVHQIELEMQNDELKLSKGRIELIEGKYTELFAFAPFGYLSLTKEGEITELNFSAARLLAKERSLLVKSRFAFFISSETKPLFNDFLEKVFQTKVKESCEVKISIEDCTPKYVLIEGILSETKEECLLTLVDITRNKLEEEKLFRLSSRQKALLSAIPDIVMEVDNNKVYTWANQVGIEFFGADVIGKEATFYFEGEQETYKTVQPLFNGNEEVFYVESWQRRKDGEKRLLGWWCRVLKDEKGNVTGALSSAHDITERRKAEEALIESEERFRVIASNTPDHILIQDNDLRYTFVLNPQLGLTEADMVGKTDFDFLKKEEAEYLTTIKRRVLEKGEQFDLETSLLNSNNEPEYFYGSYIPRIDSSGKANGLIGYFKNITERKQAEEALHESEHQMRIFLDSTSDMAFLKDENFRHIIANSALCEYYGKAENEIIGKTDFDLMPEEAAMNCRKTDEQAKRLNKLTISEENVGGRCFESVKFPVETAKGEKGVGGYIRDITKRRQAEEALNESQALYFSFIEQLPNPVFRKNREGRYNLVNSEFCKIKKLKETDIIGRKPNEIASDFIPVQGEQGQAVKYADVGEDIHEKILRTGKSFEEEEEYPAPDGGLFYMHVLRMPVFDAHGSVIGTQGILFDITERKKAETELREKEVQYRALADSGMALIWSSGTDKLCNYFNEPWLKFTGRTIEQEMGNGWAEGVHPDDFDHCLNTYITAFDKQEPFDMEYRLRHVSGEYRWLRDLGIPNYNSNGEFIGYIGHCFDITEQKRVEKALQEHKELFSLFMQYSPVYTYIKEVTPTESRVLQASDNFREMVGIPGPEMVGKTMTELFPPEFAEKMTADDWAVVSNGKVLQLDEDLNGHNYTTIKFPIDQGDKKLLAGYTIDITERKQIENALKESEELFRVAFDNAPTAMSIIGPKGNYLAANPALCKMFGYTREELLGNTIKLVTHPDDEKRSNEWVRKKFNGEPCDPNFEKRYIHKDGQIIWGLVSSEWIKNEDGSQQMAIAHIQDITERKQSEIALQNSEKFLIETQKIARLGTYTMDVISGKWESSEILDNIFGIDDGFNKTIEGWVSIIHPEWQKTMADYFTNEVIGNKTRFDKEYKIIRKIDKSERWVHGLGELKFDENNQVTHMVGSIRDITEKKQAEEALLYEQYLLHSLMDNSLDVIYFKDINSRFIRINKAFAKRAGLNNPEEALGKSDFDLFSDAHSIEAFNDEQEIINSGIPVINKEEFEAWHDGRKTCVLTSKLSLFDNEGKIVGTFGISRDITERKLVEEALNESEKKFRTVVEEAVEIIFTTDNKGYFTYVNPIGIKTSGYSLDELKKIKYIDLIEPEYKHKVKRNYFKQFIEKIPVTETEYPFKTKSGEVKWFNQNTRLILENDKVTGFYVIARDVTERKLIQEALLESEERYRNYISQVSEGVYRFETDQPMDINLPVEEQVDFMYDHMLIAECNDAFLKMYGVGDRKEMIGKGHLDFHGGRDNEVNRDSMRNFIRNNYRVENAITEEFNSSGKQVYFSNSLLGIIENGHLIRTWGTQVDITEKIKAELVQQVLYAISNATLSSKDLNELIEIIRIQLGKLLDTTNFYIAFYDENTGMLSTSFEKDKKDRIESWPAEKSASGYVIKHQQSLLATETEVKKLQESGELGMVGTPSKVWLGVPLWFDKKVIGVIVVQNYDNPDAYHAKDQLMLEFVSNQVSISIERKMAEEELKKALAKAQESERLKSAFLANMSHEIRTPMNGILGFSELLKDPELTGEQQKEYIKIIEKGGARMLNIINDLIDISKVEAGLMEVSVTETNINEQMEYIYTFFKPEVERKGLQLLFKNTLPLKEAFIKTDREKMYSILTNLVKNAIKFCDKGFIEFGYHLKNQYLEFFVKDTGIGIHSEWQEVIFKRFGQADIANKRAFQGAGLGLSITKAYVEMLGGKIWVESKPGVGSTFYFTIPYLTRQEVKNVAENAEQVARNTNQVKDLKILIAEDDKASEMLLKIALKSYAKEIIITKTGSETIEVFRNNPDIDLILMDIQLPDMDGLEATQKIREFNKEVIIIAETAYGFASDREKALAAGCNDYISKPIKKEKLTELIEKYFKR